MTDKTIKMYKIVNNVKIYIIECAPDNSDKSQLILSVENRHLEYQRSKGTKHFNYKMLSRALEK